MVPSEEGVQLRERYQAVEAREAAFIRDRFCGADEAAPGGPREGRADTDSPYAHLRQVGNQQFAIPAHQDVDRLRAYPSYDGLDVLALPRPRRVQDVRSGLGIGLQ